jgi:hypothetical protein
MGNEELLVIILCMSPNRALYEGDTKQYYQTVTVTLMMQKTFNLYFYYVFNVDTCKGQRGCHGYTCVPRTHLIDTATIT